MKRPKQLTKRERKALSPQRQRPAQAQANENHIHCVSCGIHLHAEQFNAPATATYVRCRHGSQWAACVDCKAAAQALLDEHDRTGQPVRGAAAWH